MYSNEMIEITGDANTARSCCYSYQNIYQYFEGPQWSLVDNSLLIKGETRSKSHVIQVCSGIRGFQQQFQGSIKDRGSGSKIIVGVYRSPVASMIGVQASKSVGLGIASSKGLYVRRRESQLGIGQEGVCDPAHNSGANRMFDRWYLVLQVIRF